MTKENTPISYSYEETYSPITKDGIKLVSTPLNRDELGEIPIPSNGAHLHYRDPITPSKNTPAMDPESSEKPPGLPSILKKTSSFTKLPQSGEDMSVLSSFVDRHPELGYAKRNGNELNPVKCARVIFSPTKEVVSFSKGYYDDDYCEEEKLRTKHDVILEPMEFTEASPPPQNQGILNRVFSDANIPYILSMYLQILLNIIIISIIFFFAYMFYNTVSKDINNKLELYIADAKQEISLCSRQYYRNKCSTAQGQKRVPALEQSCSMWERCMNRDPQLLGKSKISAETFADIVNGFVKPVSWKALIFIVCLIFGSLLFSNLSFSSYRNKIDTTTNKNLKNRIRKLELLIDNLERQRDMPQGELFAPSPHYLHSREYIRDPLQSPLVRKNR